MKTHIILLLFALFTCASRVNAQKLYVYETVGDVKLVKGKVSSTITVRQELDMKSIINMKKGSRLVLIDPKKCKKYTLSSEGSASVENIIAKSTKSIKDVNGAYMTFIMKQINGEGVLTSAKAIDGGYASIERGDSIYNEEEEPDSIP